MKHHTLGDMTPNPTTQRHTQAPHDSTRCACGKDVGEVLDYITGLDGEPERTAVMLSLRELRLLRERVATLTAIGQDLARECNDLHGKLAALAAAEQGGG